MKTVCFCVVVLSLGLVCSQYSNSPCPGVFDFESDGHGVYGRITLRPSGPVSSLVITINVTVVGQTDYVGSIEAFDSDRLLQNYNNGIPASYRVHFPITSPLPKLTALTVNGNIICYGPGDTPRPNTYITTLSLQHTSFLKGGVPSYSTYQPQPQQLRPQRPQNIRPTQQNLLQIVGQLGDNEVYTFNNIEPTWSTGHSPYYVVNNTRPHMPPIQVYNPQPTQVFQQPNNYDQFDQNVYDRPKKPVPTRPRPYKPRPVYTTTSRPVFDPTPDQQDYYNQNRVTSDATPVRSPVGGSSVTECGVVAGGNGSPVPLILNGNSYERGEVPWLVAIYKKGAGSVNFQCGGSLVSNRHVVSAAHCMQRRYTLTSIKEILVKLGAHNLDEWQSDIVITRTIIDAAIHESYNSANLANDILVLTLEEHVEFTTFIRPVCLWSGNTELSRIVGENGVVAGWGDLSERAGKGEPRMVRVPIVGTEKCLASNPGYLANNVTIRSHILCAGDKNGTGPCGGDSGGGLYVLRNGKWRLRGIVSWALPTKGDLYNCDLNQYIIFTDTAQYLPWIRGIVSKN